MQRFRALNWDNSKVHDASTFPVIDPSFNAILIRSSADLAAWAEDIGETAIAGKNRRRADQELGALESLWSDAHRQFLCRDRVNGQLIAVYALLAH